MFFVFSRREHRFAYRLIFPEKTINSCSFLPFLTISSLAASLLPRSSVSFLTSSYPLLLKVRPHIQQVKRKQKNMPEFFSTVSSESHTISSNSSEKKIPLVDIDCNLFHKDLLSMMDVKFSVGSSHGENGDSFDIKSKSPFSILYHPSSREANIRAVFSPGSTLTDSQHGLEALMAYHRSFNDRNKNEYFVDVRTSIGIHPFHAKEESINTTAVMCTLIEKGRAENLVSCIGECGLDYSPSFPDKDLQLPWFQLQLDLAYQYNLPLFIHERLAFKDTIQCIEDVMKRHQLQPLPPTVIHCFTGTLEECKEYVSRGFFIGITGYILKTGHGPAEVASILSSGVIPLNKLMIETDSPYMYVLVLQS